MKHVISTKDFLDTGLLRDIFCRADEFKRHDALRATDRTLEGYQVVTLFYEPSTRTRLSFELAVSRLGGAVFGSENAAEFSSAIKGESIADTVRVLSEYSPLAIVLRHKLDGAADEAVRALERHKSHTALISAGHGREEHPTQALLDIYTIKSELGDIDGVDVALVGDLKNGRTVHSLVHLLALYNARIRLVSPEELRLPDKYKEYLGAHEIPFVESFSLADAQSADVVYVTRVQKEREENFVYERVKDLFVIDRSFVEGMKKKSILMHPLPRVNEIASKVDDDPRAAYFRQAGNGLYVRMALLGMIADG